MSPDPPPTLDYQPPATPSPRRHLLHQLGPAGLLAIAATTVPYVGIVTLAVAHKAIAAWLRSHGAAGAMALVASYWVLGGFAILPSWAVSGLAGWSFGQVYGSLVAMAAQVGGALVGYAFARAVASGRAAQAVREHPKWQAIHDALLERGFWRTLGLVILIRLSPLVPYSLTNYLLASARTPVTQYLLGTIIGIAPRTIAVVVACAGLEQFEVSRPGQKWDIILSIVLSIVSAIGTAWIAHSALRGIIRARK